jgi:acetyl esterase/lipase
MITRSIHQPLHPSIRAKLSAEYAAFHDEILQYIPPTETLPFSRSNASPFSITGLPDVDIHYVEDRSIDDYQIRIFSPSPRQDTPIPALIWFHGGGYVNGGLGSENGFLRFLCRYLRIIVLSVNYRHAPEHAYPAAINDCIAALQHVSDSLIEEFGLDPQHVAIGGLSAGGQLAASTALHAAQCEGSVIQPCFQMLICPVLDNTANIHGRWKDSSHAPWLTPSRMLWYRSKYLFSDEDAASYLASPLLAPMDDLKSLPATFMAIAGCDLLAPEDFAFAERLREAGISVEEKVYPGATHSVLVLAGVHRDGKIVARDACMALGKALGIDVEEGVVTQALGL